MDPGMSEIPAETAVEARCWLAGAKAAAEAIKEARIVDFMVVLIRVDTDCKIREKALGDRFRQFFRSRIPRQAQATRETG